MTVVRNTLTSVAVLARGNQVAYFRRFVNCHVPISKTIALIKDTILQLPGGQGALVSSTAVPDADEILT